MVDCSTQHIRDKKLPIGADGDVFEESAHRKGRNSYIRQLGRRAIDMDGVVLSHVRFSSARLYMLK